jgi:hypothetical protein
LREKLSETLKGLPSETAVEIWFQDEMRIGQKNGCVRQWASRGSRPRQPVDQRYDSAYLFGAVSPARNTGAALALPFADTSAMQRHIDEISRHKSVWWLGTPEPAGVRRASAGAVGAPEIETEPLLEYDQLPKLLHRPTFKSFAIGSGGSGLAAIPKSAGEALGHTGEPLGERPPLRVAWSQRSGYSRCLRLPGSVNNRLAYNFGPNQT